MSLASVAPHRCQQGATGWAGTTTQPQSSAPDPVAMGKRRRKTSTRVPPSTARSSRSPSAASSSARRRRRGLETRIRRLGAGWADGRDPVVGARSRLLPPPPTTTTVGAGPGPCPGPGPGPGPGPRAASAGSIASTGAVARRRPPPPRDRDLGAERKIGGATRSADATGAGAATATGAPAAAPAAAAPAAGSERAHLGRAARAELALASMRSIARRSGQGGVGRRDEGIARIVNGAPRRRPPPRATSRPAPRPPSATLEGGMRRTFIERRPRRHRGCGGFGVARRRPRRARAVAAERPGMEAAFRCRMCMSGPGLGSSGGGGGGGRACGRDLGVAGASRRIDVAPRLVRG